METNKDVGTVQPSASLLDRAIELAVAAHRGQTDKGGQPYILHCLRVMLAVQTEEERVAAVLHDVIEDCPDVLWLDLFDIGVPRPVMEALECLTHLRGEDYMAYIDRCAKNPIARVVKLADLRDNMNCSRLPGMTTKDLARIDKYTKATERIVGTKSAESAVPIPPVEER